MAEVDASSGRLWRLFAHVRATDDECTYSRNVWSIRGSDISLCTGLYKPCTISVKVKIFVNYLQFLFFREV